MIPKAMDSLDFVEAVMALEEVLGIEVPSNDAERFRTPREMVDWLELYLSNQRPSKGAAALLRKLAKAHDNPDHFLRHEGVARRTKFSVMTGREPYC